MLPVHFVVGGCFVGLRRGYIYILYTKTECRVYIGQTNDRNGVIGRLAGHVSPGGTFRTRLADEGVLLDHIRDLHVFAFCLPHDPRYVGNDRSHREGVEHLVQKRLHMLRGDLNPPLRIVSYVEYNPAAEQQSVKRVADQVIEAFLRAYNVT